MIVFCRWVRGSGGVVERDMVDYRLRASVCPHAQIKC